jgi:two-component sensor histidine kinase
VRVYQLLHLEDSLNDAELVRAYLGESDICCHVTLVTNQADYLQSLTENPPELVISDFRLRGFDGIEAFRLLQRHDPRTPFILFSGALGEGRAVECLKIGMTDFLLKHHLDRLPPLVERALREARERRERLVALAEIEDLNRRLQLAIRESQHRIKNNLQVLLGLVEAIRLENSESSSLTRLASHIHGLAILHDLLLHQTSVPGAAPDTVPARFALERLIPAMATGLWPRTLTLEADDIALSIKQLSALSLVLNELVSNAIKHGQGAISISLKDRGDYLHLEVSDEGPGFPEVFDPSKLSSVGLSIIESIGTWDLAGTLSYETAPLGARVRLHFKK